MRNRQAEPLPVFDVVGGARLSGTVTLSGGKNAAIPMAIGALISDSGATLTSWPADLGDIVALEAALLAAGASLERRDGALTITAPRSTRSADSQAAALDATTGALRSTPLLLTALLGRLGHGAVPLPGGCAIGERPIDVHLDCLRRLGAEVATVRRSLVARAPNGLRGTRLSVAHASTTGTQVAVLGAVLARGDSEITGANLRPENRAFFSLLSALGATLAVDEGAATVHVRGGLYGDRGPVSMAVPPSVDDAVTWWVAGLMTGGAVTVTPGACFAPGPEVGLLASAGAQCLVRDDGITLSGTSLTAFDVEVGAPPAIGSDLHPIFAALGTAAQGISTIVDRRFTRHAYALEARSLGAHLAVQGPTVRIEGRSTRRPGDVTAPDLRGGMALLLLALAAPGRSHVRRADRIERGYGRRLVEKLVGLGADVQRIPDVDAA